MEQYKEDFIKTCIEFESKKPSVLKQLFHVDDYTYCISPVSEKIKKLSPELENKLWVSISKNKQHLYMCAIDKEKRTINVFTGNLEDKKPVNFSVMYEDIKSSGIFEHMIANANQNVPLAHIKPKTLQDLNQLKDVVIGLEKTQDKQYHKGGSYFNFYQQFPSGHALENVIVYTTEVKDDLKKMAIVCKSSKMQQELRMILNLDKQNNIMSYEAGFFDSKNKKVDFCKANSALNIIKNLWNYPSLSHQDEKKQITQNIQALRDKSANTTNSIIPRPK